MPSYYNSDNPEIEQKEPEQLPRNKPAPEKCAFGWEWGIGFVRISLYGFIFHDIGFLNL
jgi:hypothetical protein